MAAFFQKDITFNKLTFHTEAFGNPSNPVCILIAGKRSTARFWTDEFCQYITNQGFFVIRYDHRDIGQSSSINWHKTPYTLSDLAKDAILILDGYGIQKAHFIGDSMGGWICQRIGIDYPERVLSLVIISAGPLEITEPNLFSLTTKEQEMLDTTSKMFLAFKSGKTLDETIENFLPIWRHMNADIPFDEDMARKFTIDSLTRMNNKNTGKNHDLMLTEFFATIQNSHMLQNIKSPTLVIHGDKDTTVLPRHGRAVAQAIPHAKMVMIKGMGHTFFNRDLEGKIAKLIAEFIKKHQNN